jgi:hypothetical protein
MVHLTTAQSFLRLPHGTRPEVRWDNKALLPLSQPQDTGGAVGLHDDQKGVYIGHGIGAHRPEVVMYVGRSTLLASLFYLVYDPYGERATRL